MREKKKERGMGEGGGKVEGERKNMKKHMWDRKERQERAGQ